MPYIVQHYPAYVSGFENKVNNFYSEKELLSIYWVDNFKDNKNFSKFSISNDEKQYLLMAEYEEGEKWFVVGYLIDDEISVWEVLKDMPKFNK